MRKPCITIALRTPLVAVLLCVNVTVSLSGSDPSSGLIDPAAKTVSTPSGGVDWGGVLKESSLFLAMQHGFRLATEPGTRSAAIPSAGSYLKSISSLHGWSDGDPFYVNYVGHPMQGSVTGFIWAQNDRKYRNVEFGRNADYWRGRLRAFGYMWAYSTQFEIGPFSEAAIGRIQSRYPQQGLVDHVVTPVFGLGWQVAEDALDKYVISTLERKFANPYASLLLRGWLNPTRSWANMMRGKVPWHRDTRAGVLQRNAQDSSGNNFIKRDGMRSSVEAEHEERPDLAPVELTATAGSQGVWGSYVTCIGAGAEAAFRLASQWQILAAVSGCKLGEMPSGFSGDSLTYSAGPRWTPFARKRWSPWVQLRLGGNLLSQEESIISKVVPQPEPSRNNASGFIMAAGGGLDFSMSRYASLRIASVEFSRSWAGDLPQQRNIGGIQLRSGITLKIGTW